MLRQVVFFVELVAESGDKRATLEEEEKARVRVARGEDEAHIPVISIDCGFLYSNKEHRIQDLESEAIHGSVLIGPDTRAEFSSQKNTYHRRHRLSACSVRLSPCTRLTCGSGAASFFDWWSHCCSIVT